MYLPLCPSAVDSGGAGGARAPQDFGGSEKWQSLISAYQSLAFTASTSGFENLSTALYVGMQDGQRVRILDTKQNKTKKET